MVQEGKKVPGASQGRGPAAGLRPPPSLASLLWKGERSCLWNLLSFGDYQHHSRPSVGGETESSEGLGW